MTPYSISVDDSLDYYAEKIRAVLGRILKIEEYEKKEGVEIVRKPKDIDLMFQLMDNELAKLEEALPLDEIEHTDRRRRAILRIIRCQNYLTVKVGLLRRMSVLERLRKKKTERI